MAVKSETLRIMFIAGSLGKGGAEKQLVYMLRTLQNLGASVQVFSLSDGEFHEQTLQDLGLNPVALGYHNPPARVIHLIQAVRKFRPHFLQATHFFASFYAGLVGKLTRTTSIGAIRGDFHHDLAGMGNAAKITLGLPSVFLANSSNARSNALRFGLNEDRIHVVRNVIDTKSFDQKFAASPSFLLNSNKIHAITVARLMPVKRLERFIRGIALAAEQVRDLEGIVVGGGPQENNLRDLASSLGLQPDQTAGSIQFLGEQQDIPQLLAQSEMFVLTSQREGFPNVVLEAMAASLPVITTPAGECIELVVEGKNGYIIPFDDDRALANRMVELAQSPAKRRALGNAGRHMVETHYDYPRLGEKLIDFYRTLAEQQNNQTALSILGKYADTPNRSGFTQQDPSIIQQDNR